ncbi:MAG: methionine biosynthesis protein MetW [Stagnimonas sp.]|nr:methionine biosynthesis protein MetW [Stagnimonas sp.]
MRADLAALSPWIPEGARILDLGCGDGGLLAHLAARRGVHGYGLEIDPANVAACVARGVNVIQADLDQGLSDFADGAFDVVVMSQALQALQRPDAVVAEMLRVGQSAIVTFPNFGHWRVRRALLAGRMPVTPSLPERWFDTPNIHLCTVADFEDLCARRGWSISRRALLDRRHRESLAIRLLPNLFCEQALYELRRPGR